MMKNKNHIAKAEMLIRKPITEVFEAFINPDITSKFWFTKSTGRLDESEKVVWRWEMYNLDVPVEIKKIEPNKSILIEWGTGEHLSTVEWTFQAIPDNNTFVTIRNYNFQSEGDKLMSQVIDSTGGFTLVIAGLKAWLEHNIQLNLVGDKFPKEMM